MTKYSFVIKDRRCIPLKTFEMFYHGDFNRYLNPVESIGEILGLYLTLDKKVRGDFNILEQTDGKEISKKPEILLNDHFANGKKRKDTIPLCGYTI